MDEPLDLEAIEERLEVHDAAYSPGWAWSMIEDLIHEVRALRADVDSVTPERDVMREQLRMKTEELRAVKSSRDQVVAELSRRNSPCAHVVISAADRDREEAVRADERREIRMAIDCRRDRWRMMHALDDPRREAGSEALTEAAWIASGGGRV